MEPREFEEFWKAYPHRVGKLVAMKAFEKARRIASQTDILAGVAAYIEHKPDYADFAHPSSWLAAGRWMDEWDAPAVKVYDPDYCQHEPRCHSRTWHEVKLENEKAS